LAHNVVPAQYCPTVSLATIQQLVLAVCLVFSSIILSAIAAQILFFTVQAAQQILHVMLAILAISYLPIKRLVSVARVLCLVAMTVLINHSATHASQTISWFQINRDAVSATTSYLVVMSATI
jgi:DMSO/TMAO reductase YedYZ heme-binding membrane subunit